MVLLYLESVMTNTLKTEKALFIIESLDFEDEKKRREGRILRQMLRLSEEKAKYIYIRTQQELDLALKEFKKSGYRYLHISCHGSHDSIGLSLDQMPFEDFAAEVRPYLEGKRLFFSACGVVNERLADALLSKSGCHSLVGPKESIRFDDALLAWASFYHLVFRDSEESLKGGKIRWALRRIRHTFGIEFDYYRATKNGFEKSEIDVR
jgi:hypothetical protein